MRENVWREDVRVCVKVLGEGERKDRCRGWKRVGVKV